MNRVSRTIPIALALALALLVAQAPTSLFAQGTAFTYQGRLNSGGAPANGSYDLAFTLFNSNGGGPSLAGPVTNTAVSVTNGLFTTLVDFGPGVFIGGSNWLQIAVSTNAANAFFTLTPLQQVTPTPYALLAGGASNLLGTLPASQLSGVLAAANIGNGTITSGMLVPDAVTMLGTPGNGPTNTVNVSSNGLVGIGTGNATPAAGLQLATSAGETTLVVEFETQNYNNGFTNIASASCLATNGNLLAIGSFTGVTLVNVANPAAPQVLSQLVNGVGTFTNIGGVNGLAWSGSNLVVGAQISGAATIISCTNPAAPVKLAEIVNGFGGGNYCSNVWNVAVCSNLLAIAGRGSSAVTLADISNPAAPVFKSVMVNGTFGFNNLASASGLAFASNNVLAIGAVGSSAVTLVNVSNPSNPTVLSQLVNGVGGYNYLVSPYNLAINGNLLAIPDESSGAISLVDITAPASPVLDAQMVSGIGGYSLNGAYAVSLTGNRLAIASLSGNATLVDVSKPTNPVLLAAATAGVNGADYLGNPYGVAFFGGTNLAVCNGNGLGGLTLFGTGTASVGLDSTGWVGIGTTQPKAALDVVGNVVVENATLFNVAAGHVEFGDQTVATGLDSTALRSQTKATSAYSFAGGYGNTAAGNGSVVVGGGYDGTLVGGNVNFGNAAFIGGGLNNSISTSDNYAAIAGGTHNTILPNSPQSFIGGGGDNTASGDAGNFGSLVIGGGWNNLINPNSQYSAILGGWNNVIGSGFYAGSSVIGGGAFNDNSSPNAVIGGGWNNLILTNAPASFIGGGNSNVIAGDTNGDGFKVIVGGNQNVISNNSWNSSIVGGQANVIGTGGIFGFIGGGANNQIVGNSPNTVISGGELNIANTSQNAFIGGGYANRVGATYATIPGGIDNLASGYASFAAGFGAQAIYNGDFVWADSEGGLFSATGWNQFLIRASGGVGVGTASPQASMDIESSNGISTPQLRLVQQASGDYSRLRYQSGAMPNWDVAVGGANDQMNWFVPNDGNIMTLQTNGMLTTGGLTVNNNGAIHVSGAGQNTGTAAFVQTVTSANWNGYQYTVINNPLCNGNPKAILMLTRSLTPSSPDFVSDPGAAYYSQGSWAIYSTNLSLGDTFNVLVILP